MNNCNNCDKQGHQFHQCRLPITSCGIILFRIHEDKLQFLMIRRKDSFGYIDIMRGKYSMSNMLQMQTIVDEMSIPEKRKILESSIRSEHAIQQYKNEDSISRKKMDALKLGITVNNESVTLE